MGKPKLTPSTTIIAILLMLLPCINYAQSVNTGITVQQAIAQALKNNATIKAGNYEIDYSKALKRTATDIGKTNVSLTLGQFNSINTDNNISINQSII